MRTIYIVREAAEGPCPTQRPQSAEIRGYAATQRKAEPAEQRNYRLSIDDVIPRRAAIVRIMAEERDPLTYRIIGCAIAVHREFGPGLLESAYEEALEREMIANGLMVTRQPEVKVAYEGALLHRGFRPDFVINGRVVVEIKSVDSLHPVHVAQVLTYMRFSGMELGLLINFNVKQLIKGVRRLILSNQPPL